MDQVYTSIFYIIMVHYSIFLQLLIKKVWFVDGRMKLGY